MFVYTLNPVCKQPEPVLDNDIIELDKDQLQQLAPTLKTIILAGNSISSGTHTHLYIYIFIYLSFYPSIYLLF